MVRKHNNMYEIAHSMDKISSSLTHKHCETRIPFRIQKIELTEKEDIQVLVG